MSDTLLSTLGGSSGLLLSIDGGIDSGDSCDYTCANENDAPLTGVSLGAAGECAERLHSLAILGLYMLSTWYVVFADACNHDIMMKFCVAMMYMDSMVVLIVASFEPQGE